MATFDDLSFSVAEFSGKVRLFPLPNLVLFPHVMQPLHVFEPRYRQMLEDALAGDRLIAMAVLAPGWEDDYEGRPPLYPVACLGQIASHHRLEDGTYNLLVLGLRRVRLVRELDPVNEFREAEVELCEEHCPAQRDTDHACLQRQLRQAFLRVLPLLPEAQEQLDQLLCADVTLAMLTDVIGYMLDIDLGEKHALLSELDVYRRAEMILAHLLAVAEDEELGTSGATPFPPQFSLN